MGGGGGSWGVFAERSGCVWSQVASLQVLRQLKSQSPERELRDRQKLKGSATGLHEQPPSHGCGLGAL